MSKVKLNETCSANYIKHAIFLYFKVDGSSEVKQAIFNTVYCSKQH